MDIAFQTSNKVYLPVLELLLGLLLELEETLLLQPVLLLQPGLLLNLNSRKNFYYISNGWNEHFVDSILGQHLTQEDKRLRKY